MRALRNLISAAKNVRNPTDPNIAGVPRPQSTPTLHTVEVTKVDVGRKVLGVKLNDPDGTVLDTGIPWLQTFSPDRPPEVGQSVRAFYLGGQLQVLGFQDVADDTVTFD